jgi:thymidylate synthase (FAD)
MSVKLEFKGKQYRNVVEMGKDMPMHTSVMIGWYDGAELLIANAAANCYDTPIKGNLETGEPCKLSKKIMLHCRDSGHNTVIEHGAATFFKKVPIFVARQDLRARIASFDERSLRYTKISRSDEDQDLEVDDLIKRIVRFERKEDGSLLYYVPDYLSAETIARVKKDHPDNTYADRLLLMRHDWIEQHERTIDFYSKFIDEDLKEMFDAIGVESERVRETARATLPLGIMTTYVDTRNLWSWLHHSAKRLCLRAQKEIRMVRHQEVRALAKVFPTIFGDVNMPCYQSQGCPETKTCGLIDLDETGRWAKTYLNKQTRNK